MSEQAGPEERPRDSSFLVRWRERAGEQRIDLEHVQSGTRTRVSSLAAAMAWISAMRTRPPGRVAEGRSEEGEPWT